MNPRLSPELKKLLEKQHYAFIGNHSAIKICEWTKKSLRDEDFCYKQKFYGIKSHLCCQMSPSIEFCQNRCLFCWRPVEFTVDSKLAQPIDDPKEIIKNAIKAQQKQLIGFKGNEKANLRKLKQAMNPKHFAISLAGEPLLYPKINELIKELHKQNKTTFVVSNGLCPEAFKKLEPPTQVYVSINAPNEELFKRIVRPVIKNAWQKFNKSLSIMKTFSKKTRAVLRLTLIKNLNMIEPENYAKLIKKASPMFVEIKAYMRVGYSRKRLAHANMPKHPEVKDFAKEILKYLPEYKLKDEKKESRVVLLTREN